MPFSYMSTNAEQILYLFMFLQTFQCMLRNIEFLPSLISLKRSIYGLGNGGGAIVYLMAAGCAMLHLEIFPGAQCALAYATFEIDTSQCPSWTK